MPLKKLIVLLLSVCIFGLAACGGGNTPPEGQTENSGRPADARVPGGEAGRNAQASGQSETSPQDVPSAGAGAWPGHQLVGLWRGEAEAKGLAARLVFLDNNTFLWTAGPRDGMERLRARSGYWFVEAGKLELEIREEIRWEGGVLAPAPSAADWATEHVIADREKALITLTEPARETLDLGEVTGSAGSRAVTIGGNPYWELPGPEELDAFYAGYAETREWFSRTRTVPEDMSPAGFWNRQYALPGSTTFAASHLFRPDGTFTAFQRSETPPDVAARTNQKTMQLMGLTVGKYRLSEGKIECYEAYHLSGNVLGSPWYEQHFGADYELMKVMEAQVPEEYLQPIEPFSYGYKMIAPGPFLVLTAADGTEELLASKVITLPHGCWETTDRGDAQDGIERQDITLDGETVSVRADWKALEIAIGNPGFSRWERGWEDGKWVMRCNEGSAVTDGEYLLLSKHSETLYESAEFAGLAFPTGNGIVPDSLFTVIKVNEWDGDFLELEGWEPLYNFAGKADKPPRVW